MTGDQDPKLMELSRMFENARVHDMTDEEREAQRQSWARGQSQQGPRHAVAVSDSDITVAVRAERDRVLREFESLAVELEDVRDISDDGAAARGMRAALRYSAKRVAEFVAKLRGAS